MSLFLRLLEADDKAAALRDAVQVARSGQPDARVFDVDPEGFRLVPGAPFAYWVSRSVLRLFQAYSALESGQTRAVGGLKSGDDARFVRLSWETPLPIDDRTPRFRLFSKGGAFSSFYFDVHLKLAWLESGRQIYSFYLEKRDIKGGLIRNPEYYFRPGLTWPRRTQGGLSIRAMPAGCIFADKGPAAFIDGDDPPSLLSLLAVVNSRPFRALVALQISFGSYEVGVLQHTPIPHLTTDDGQPTNKRHLAQLAHRAWSLKRSLDTSTETSHAFILPALLQVEGEHLAERAAAWSLRVAETQAELARIQAEIDHRCFILYGIDGEDRRQIEHGFGEPADARIGTPDEEDGSDDGTDPADQAPLTAALLSWTVGVAFARFDPRLATGERAIPPEPEPFDPLPARSPGMYPDGEELADRPDILVDDQGHADDLAARVRAVAERVKVDVPENLRGWLAKDFFPLHIRMYSKSRRKAPIYWQLATPSATYSVWLYIHAFSKDTLFRVQNDYVAPKLAHEERRLEALTAEQRDGATATERKALAEQQTLVEELRAFLAEVKCVAPLWNPNLDDGVIINFAPLWRLVPQHKAWQKELKSTWDALCDGKYDWAHLAMHIWPERVVPKCAKDRSLAIAHDLENVFWEEDDNGKWQPVKVPQAEIDQLIAERTSAAVKDALQNLLDAPPPSAGRSGGRRTSGRGSARRTQSATGRQRSSAAAPPDPAVIDAIKQAIDATGAGASKADVLAATGLNDAQWNGAIAALLAEGSVTKSGAGRGIRYHRLNP